MSKTTVIKLGGNDYVVPQLNIGQLERVTDIFSVGGHRAGFRVLRIACERASPAIANFDEVEATTDEVAAAVAGVLQMSGLAKDAPAGEAAPAGAS